MNGIRSRVDRHTGSHLHARIHEQTRDALANTAAAHARSSSACSSEGQSAQHEASSAHTFSRKMCRREHPAELSVREKNYFLPDSSLSRGQIVCTNRDAVAGERTGEAGRCDRRHERSHEEPSAAPHAVPLVLKVLLTARDVAGTSAQQFVCRRCCATHTSIRRRLPSGATAPERSAQRPTATCR